MIPGNGTYTVAIVGGGAVGTALFDRLVDRLPAHPSPRAKPRIVLFEKSRRIGPGLAYASDDSPYLVNQSAQTMSLVPGHRTHFHEWLAARGLAGADDDETICARPVFGDYAEDCFARAVDEARRRDVPVTTIQDEVSALVPRRLGGYRVLTRGEHAPVDADIVVLALGNLPSTRFRVLEGAGFVRSPYPSDAMCARVRPTASVAVLGTGLSAIDAALALFAAGRTSPVTMASRSGLLPAVRGPLLPHELRYVTRSNIAAATDHGRVALRLHTVLRWLEGELGGEVSWDRDFPAWVDALEHVGSQVAAARGGARLSQSVGEALNPVIEHLWHHLADDEKALFLDRFYSRFMSHWVPVPLVTGRRVLSLLGERKLAVERNLVRVTRGAEGRGFHLHFPDRVEAFDFLVDATGAPRHLTECDSLLVQSLAAQGTVVPHAAGGLRVDFESLRVLGKDGRPDASLFAVGGLTFGTHFFTNTLELCVEKADRVAALVLSELHRRSERDHHVDAATHST